MQGLPNERQHPYLEETQHAPEGPGRAPSVSSRPKNDPPWDPPLDPPPVTPYEVVYEAGKVRLRYYRAAGKPQPLPLLLVYALIKRPYILDLVPDRSIVQTFVKQGFNVYLTDWIPPTLADRWRGFDAYVNQDLANAVQAIRIREDAQQVCLLGYCLGGLLGVVYTALHPKTVHSLITLAVPLGVEAHKMSFSGVMAPFLPHPVDWVTQTYGNCPAWFIKASMTALAPSRLFLPVYLSQDIREDVREDLRQPWAGQTNNHAGSSLYSALQQWMNSDVPMAGQIFHEVMKDIFADNSLAQSRLQVGGQLVRLCTITCPVLNIMGKYDGVVRAKASQSLIELVGSSDTRNLTFPRGHIGLAVSRAAHTQLWPQVGAWLRERAG